MLWENSYVSCFYRILSVDQINKVVCAENIYNYYSSWQCDLLILKHELINSLVYLTSLSLSFYIYKHRNNNSYSLETLSYVVCVGFCVMYMSIIYNIIYIHTLYTYTHRCMCVCINIVFFYYERLFFFHLVLLVGG